MLRLHYCTQALSSCGEWGLLSSSGAWASHCGGLFCYCSWTPACRLSSCGLGSWPAASGIFLEQGMNLFVLHWQADSQPLDHQGSPCIHLCIQSFIYISVDSGIFILYFRFNTIFCYCCCSNCFNFGDLSLGFCDALNIPPSM